MRKEIWKDITGYEGLYQVSNIGMVRSLNYRRTGRVQLLKLYKDRGGYLNVVLCKDGKEKRNLVHRLVAEAFIPNPDNLPQVNHKDENPSNNRVENLEWCDCKYNQNFGTRNERISKTMINGKTSKTVLQYTLDGKFVREWPSMMECKRNGFRISAVSCCCRGEKYHHTYKGYIWRFKTTENAFR